MTTIYEPKYVAAYFKTGFNALKDKLDVSMLDLETEVAALLKSKLTPETVRRWKTPAGIPINFEDGVFWGMIWFILRSGNVSLKWLEELLSATSVPISPPITRDILVLCLAQVRLCDKPLTPSEIEEVVTLYFPSNQDHEPQFDYHHDRELFYELKPLQPILRDYIKASQEICVQGISLYRYIPHYRTEFARALQKGVNLRVILVHPNSAAVEMSAFRSSSQASAQLQRDDILRTLETLRSLKNHIANARVEVRLLDYMPGFGITVYKHHTDEGLSVCEVHLYPFKTSASYAAAIGPHPIFHKHWFAYFSDQFERMWNAAEVWNGDKL